jgi:hypothetical protein
MFEGGGDPKEENKPQISPMTQIEWAKAAIFKIPLILVVVVVLGLFLIF